MDSLLLFAEIHAVICGYHRCLFKRLFAVYYGVEGELVHVFALSDRRRNPSWIG